MERTCIAPHCGRPVGSKGSPHHPLSCGKGFCDAFALGYEEALKARDPNSIDLEHPETSGIGRPPRDGDMRIRTMCHSLLQLAERDATPHDEWSAQIWTAWLLRRLPVEVIAEIAPGILHTALSIIEQERETKAAGEAAAATGTSTSGTSDSSPSRQSAAAAPSPALKRRRRR